MSSESPISNDHTRSSVPTVRASMQRTRLVNALPWMWLVLSAAWAAVIFITDQVAWPLALWIATTVGPLTAFKSRLDPNTDPQRSNR